MTEQTVNDLPAEKPSFHQRKELFFENHPWFPSVLKLLTYLGYTLITLMILLTLFMKTANVSPMSVVSDSMVPTFERGDLILVSHDYNALSVGDIVVYHQGVQNRDVVHRIIEISGNAITVQGDANPSPDPTFNRSAIKGEVMGIIPNLAYLFFKQSVIFIVAASIILSFVTDGWKIRFRKRKLGRHEPAYFAQLANETKEHHND